MGIDFKFFDKRYSDNEIPDETEWWQEREVNAALEEAGRRMREMRNVLNLQPGEAFPIIEKLVDTITLSSDDIYVMQNDPNFINHIKRQQANRFIEYLIDNDLIEFITYNDMQNNVVMKAKLNVQKINRQ